MALMSVKRYLTQMEEEAAYRRLVSMLLDAVATNALNLDREACRSYCERIGELRQEMASDTTVESLMSHAAAAAQAIGEYAQETNRLLHSQIEELQNTIATLAQASANAGGSDKRIGAPQSTIGAGLGRVAVAQSISMLKASLHESLSGIREETTQQRAELDHLAQALRAEISHQQESSPSSDLDPVTELPCEAAARAQFLAALHSGEQKHVAVFVLGSAQRINLRFGRAAGDEVVRELKRYVAGQLQPGDGMFRWPGPAIVALLATAEPFDKVRTRMKRFLEKPIERDFDINGRSVLIPLSIAWSVYPVSLPLAGLNRQIHDFIAGRGYRDEDPIPA
jgi:GGDEF domain-containing protein